MLEKFKKVTKENWVVMLILIFAAMIRLWNLENIPPHLTPDEAALGYNAYSILKTGRDEYGEFLPVIFKSFGDYKPGLYIYLTVPFVVIFGLTEVAVRLPSAISGIISVLFVYLIAKVMFDKKIAIWSAFLMAVTPWSFYFSRAAWEVNVSLTFTLGGVYFFLKSLKNSKFLIISSLFFSSTLLLYQGAKLSTGIVVFLLVLLYRQDIINFFKSAGGPLAGSILISILIVSPVILSIFQGKAGRLEVFSVFSYPRPKEYLENFLVQGNEKTGSLNYYFFHSETLNFTRGILGRWFNHFSARFLFFEGDWPNPRHTSPNHGMLILVQLVLIVGGFIALVKKGLNKENLFVWLWLILAPLPAVLSRDQVHAVRSLNTIAPLIFVMSLGGAYLMTKWRRLFLLLFLALFFVNYLYFLDSYFIHLSKHDSRYWDYGYKQIVEKVTSIQSSYKTVKVQQSFAQPYIYFLFYQKYDPAKYQKQAKLVSSEYKGDVGYVTTLDNIEFAPIDWSVNRGEHGTLFVADPIRIPPEDSKDEDLFRLIAEIRYLNGRDMAFRIVEVK